MLFSCSIHAMFNRVNRSGKQRLMLNSYLPGINTSNFPKRHYENIFSEKLVNELHECIKNHPNVIHSSNASDSLFVNLMVIL